MFVYGKNISKYGKIKNMTIKTIIVIISIIRSIFQYFFKINPTKPIANTGRCKIITNNVAILIPPTRYINRITKRAYKTQTTPYTTDLSLTFIFVSHIEIFLLSIKQSIFW